ncbi:MAG: conjugal transfer mating pair stabilization protein TraN [Pseudomonadota bacterium]|nr:conjugal transfer mating pair stabilization protein TraN [Pseudomonadota bacterium]
MLKGFLMMLYVSLSISQSATMLQQEALKSLEQLNPNGLIPHYNAHPQAENLHPEQQEDKDYLKTQGLNQLPKNADAQFIYENEANRIKITENEKDPIFQEAQSIIEQSKDNLTEQCHYEKVPCDEKKTSHTCHEKARYEHFSCDKSLEINFSQKNHPVITRLIQFNQIYDLTQCGKDSICTPLDITSRCHHLIIKVTTTSGRSLVFAITPSCQSPQFSVTGTQSKRAFVKIEAQELWEEERWVEGVCDFQNAHYCVAKGPEHCTEGPLEKSLNGIIISKDCWKKSQDFDCAVGFESTCQAFIDKGCSNTDAQCALPQGDRCDEIERTYQCTEKTCYPDKKVCADVLPCLDGACDQSQSEESDDIQEGISRLGVVAGAGEEVSSQQKTLRLTDIFKGSSFSCSRLALGARDCCEGEGFLEGLLHCPQEFKELQRAKLEKRAILVGDYRETLNLKKVNVYCLFPSKLAGILQIQGRFGQLGIGFGDAQHPVCDKGLDASLLERIDFKRLDLSSIVDDFKAKAKFKTLEDMQAQAESRAASLHEKGGAHD